MELHSLALCAAVVIVFLCAWSPFPPCVVGFRCWCQERQRILRAHLVLATVHVRSACLGIDAALTTHASPSDSVAVPSVWSSAVDMSDVLVSLWCHQFASLVPEPGTEASLFAGLGSTTLKHQPFATQHLRITFDVLLLIARHQVGRGFVMWLQWRVHAVARDRSFCSLGVGGRVLWMAQYPPNPEWPWTTTTLCHLIHGNGSSRDVSVMVEDNKRFWVDLGKDASEGTLCSCMADACGCCVSLTLTWCHAAVHLSTHARTLLLYPCTSCDPCLCV